MVTLTLVKVFTKSFDLDQIQEAYEAMDKREAIKSYIIMDGFERD